MSERLAVHQALHGYARGHRLLASSLPLPPDAESLLLTMSDFAGTRVIQGFESYLTGYPVIGTPLYALAQTWYAHEMPRPGSVWTHTLLLHESVVAALDLRLLHSLPFRRPGMVDAPESYSWMTELGLSYASTTPALPPAIEYIDPAPVVRGLYSRPDAAVVLYVEEAAHASDLLFRVWLQQWPALRFRFTFSTGSMGPRSIARRPIDLQAAPRVERYSWGRLSDGDVVEVDAHSAGQPAERWIQLLVDDLRYRNADFHEFMTAYAVDVVPNRDRMASLCQVFLSLEDGERECAAAESVQLISKAFRMPTEASRLKRALLTGAPLVGVRSQPEPSTVVRRFAEVLALEEQVGFSADHVDSARLKEILAGVGDSEQSSLWHGLLTHEHSPIARELGKQLAGALDGAEIAALARRHSGLLHFFVELRPALACMPDLWRISASARAEMVDALASSGQGAGLAGDVVDLMLELELHDVAGALLERLGAPAVWEVLRRMGNRPEVLRIPDPWRRAVARRQSDVLSWLCDDQVRPDALVRAFGQVLDDSSPSQWSIPAVAVNRVLNRIQGAAEAEWSLVASFFLAMALTERSQEWIGVVTKTFATVHAAGAADRLSYRELAWLESCLPEVSGWKRWDKCHRLRKALVELVVKDQWPETVLLEAAAEEGTVRRIFELLDKKGKRSDVLRRLSSVASSDSRFSHLRGAARGYT